MHRIAQPGDEARLDAFLAQRPASAMFLRSNLAAHGLSGQGHDHATTYHLWEKNGQIAGVFGLTQNQNTMVQFPDDALHDQICIDLPRVLASQPIAVMTGLSSEVQMALGALGLSDEDLYKLNHDEPLYQRDLTGFVLEQGALRRPEARDFDLLARWFFGHFQDTGIGDGSLHSDKDALVRAERAIRGDGTWLLCDERGLPVAMAGLNARVGDTVQVGSVYVPTELRNRGLGRTIVSKMLNYEASQGTRRAILFSNNDAASRAYEAIGFEQIGTFRVAILKEPACL